MKKNNKNKKKIILSSLKIFNSQGIKKTSMEDIARVSGLTRITLYRYFENKEALVAAAFFQIVELLTQVQESIRGVQNPEVEGTLDQIASGLSGLSDGDFPGLQQELLILYPEVYHKFQLARRRTIKSIFDLLLKSSRLGEGLNQEIVEIFFMDAVITFMENPRLVGEGYSPDEIYNTVKSLFLYGVFGKDRIQ